MYIPDVVVNLISILCGSKERTHAQLLHVIRYGEHLPTCMYNMHGSIVLSIEQ